MAQPPTAAGVAGCQPAAGSRRMNSAPPAAGQVLSSTTASIEPSLPQLGDSASHATGASGRAEGAGRGGEGVSNRLVAGHRRSRPAGLTK